MEHNLQLNNNNKTIFKLYNLINLIIMHVINFKN